MANLLTTDELREHLETDLVEAALARLNDDAQARVDEHAGPLATETDIFQVVSADYPDGRDRVISLTRPLDSVTNVTEQIFDADPVVLAVDDYFISGNQLQRLTTGTNPRTYWGHKVTVVYAPVNNEATRKGVIIDLVKLAVAYQGVKADGAGDYRMTAPAYKAARAEVLDALTPTYSFA